MDDVSEAVGMEMLGMMFNRYERGLVRPPEGWEVASDGYLLAHDEERAMSVVAELRFPIDVRALDSLIVGLQLAYGTGLTMRGEGDFLVIEDGSRVEAQVFTGGSLEYPAESEPEHRAES